jgi:hypothetical protein
VLFSILFIQVTSHASGERYCMSTSMTVPCICMILWVGCVLRHSLCCEHHYLFLSRPLGKRLPICLCAYVLTRKPSFCFFPWSKYPGSTSTIGNCPGRVLQVGCNSENLMNGHSDRAWKRCWTVSWMEEGRAGVYATYCASMMCCWRSHITVCEHLPLPSN